MDKLHRVVSIKLSEPMLEQADDQASIRGFSNHGQYIRWLIARDGEMLEEAITNRRHPVSSVDTRHG